MQQRFLRYMQAQLSQIMIFRKTFSKSKLLFQILPLNRKLLQGNSFRRTHLATLSTCKTRLMIHTIRLTTLSTVSTRFSTRSTRLSTRSTHLSTCSTFFPLVVSVCPLVVSVCPLVLSACPLVVLVVLSVGLFITGKK